MANITLTESFINSYAVGMHVNSGLSIFMTSISVYLILFKTPTDMQAYKWYLLNVVVSYSLTIVFPLIDPLL
jgi:accessory gene regulator protein AgrB